MANRSSFNSVLPRADARLLSLTEFPTVQYEREVRKLFIEAHAHFRRAKNSTIRRVDVGVARGADQDDGAE